MYLQPFDNEYSMIVFLQVCENLNFRFLPHFHVRPPQVNLSLFLSPRKARDGDVYSFQDRGYLRSEEKYSVLLWKGRL